MENVTLTATGYDWTCPGCGKNNYEGKKKFEVVCARCKKGSSVTEVKHKGNPAGELVMITGGENKVVLTASAYSFECPECQGENFVEKPVERVHCKICKYSAEVVDVAHCGEERKEKKSPALKVIGQLAIAPECRQMALF
jgi:hypothetical protein